MLLKGLEEIKELEKQNDPDNRKIRRKNLFIYIIILIIILYQKIISPFFGQKCRFIPTCSNYSITALKRYGLIKGFFISIKRISKCHPWNKGGYDPVP